jgi:hypothetical protein
MSFLSRLNSIFAPRFAEIARCSAPGGPEARFEALDIAPGEGEIVDIHRKHDE